MSAKIATLVTALLLAGAPLAAAQDEEEPERPAGGKSVPLERLTITVQGHACVPADQVEVEVVVQAQGEDAESAEKRHREKLRSVQRALERLKASFEGKEVPPEKPVKKKGKKADPDEEDAPRPAKEDPEPAAPKDESPDPPSFTIELREGRSSIGIQRAQNADGTSEGPVTIATAVLLKMKGISECSKAKVRKRLAAILDAAIEAGADSGVGGVGSRPAFRFRARDNEELRALAQTDALKKGRARAKRLAALADRELGTLKAIGETGWLLRSGSTDQVGFDSVIGRIGNNKLNNYEMTTSSSDIELECELTLEFELGRETKPEPKR